MPTLPAEAGRTILVVIDGLPPDPALPGAIVDAVPIPTAWARLSEDLGSTCPDIAPTVIAGAVEGNLLVMSIDLPSPDIAATRDNISLFTVQGDSGPRPGSDPPDILLGTDMSGWGSLPGRQGVARVLADRFGPEMIISSCSTGSIDTAVAVAGQWLGEASLRGSTVFLVSPPRPGWYRGWAVMAMQGIEPGCRPGLTPCGLLNTILLSAGLEPAMPLSRGVPIHEVLRRTEEP